MPPKIRLNGLDHLRALAIILVFIYHYGRLFASPQWLTDLGKFGWTGVDLFFVLSGYLIATQLFTDGQEQGKISVKTFYIKRFFRILPPYLLVVAIYFLFPDARERAAPAPLWKYLTFTQNLGLDVSIQGTFSHAWSLCIEEQFYLLFPFALIILQKTKLFHKSWWLIPSLLIAGIILRACCWNILVSNAGDYTWIYWYKYIYYPTYTRLDGLLIGISIAAMLRFQPLLTRRIQSYSHFIMVAGLMILTAAYFICEDQSTFPASVYGFPLVSIGYGCLVFAAVSPANLLYRHSSIITSYIAILSYALYLIHKIVIHLVQQYVVRLNIERDSVLTLLIATASCILAAVLMREIVEKPSSGWRKRFLQ
ncbi:acyltransferase family protein [Chitinophaga sp. Hz27]|uniref:acyltransferase family protein n=1 Tax=Chitinophaga sp. Hz27 TaxID=3347169 RepID=UPI0035DB71E7